MTNIGLFVMIKLLLTPPILAGQPSKLVNHPSLLVKLHLCWFILIFAGVKASFFPGSGPFWEWRPAICSAKVPGLRDGKDPRQRPTLAGAAWFKATNFPPYPGLALALDLPSSNQSWKGHMGMDQYLWIPFLGGGTSIYQLFWCSPGVQGFDTLPYHGREKWMF